MLVCPQKPNKPCAHILFLFGNRIDLLVYQTQKRVVLRACEPIGDRRGPQLDLNNVKLNGLVGHRWKGEGAKDDEFLAHQRLLTGSPARYATSVIGLLFVR